MLPLLQATKIGDSHASPNVLNQTDVFILSLHLQIRNNLSQRILPWITIFVERLAWNTTRVEYLA